MKIEVEIGLQMVIPELQKLPEFQDNYDEYYNMYNLIVEVCNLFTKYQDDYITTFSGEDDTFYVMCVDHTDDYNDGYNDMVRVSHNAVFSLRWERFLSTIDFSALLEKHSIIDNSKNIDYLYEPECELRREY